MIMPLYDVFNTLHGFVFILINIVWYFFLKIFKDQSDSVLEDTVFKLNLRGDYVSICNRSGVFCYAFVAVFYKNLERKLKHVEMFREKAPDVQKGMKMN